MPSPMPCGARRLDPLLALPVEGRCQQLARDLVALRRPAVIAVEGVDGSGKTTFAGQLAGTIEAAGRPALVVHEDDFLSPRETRHRLGKESPQRFIRDPLDDDDGVNWDVLDCGVDQSVGAVANTRRWTSRAPPGHSGSRTCRMRAATSVGDVPPSRSHVGFRAICRRFEPLTCGATGYGPGWIIVNLSDSSARDWLLTRSRLRSEQVIEAAGGGPGRLFDAVFVLEIDVETLSRRLDQRPQDEFGARPPERQLIMRLHWTGEDTPTDAVLVDATATLTYVVDEILRLSKVTDRNLPAVADGVP
ncbi:MAG: hypothetical protein ABI112_11405 [Terracoccus sp.]